MASFTKSLPPVVVGDADVSINLRVTKPEGGGTVVEFLVEIPGEPAKAYPLSAALTGPEQAVLAGPLKKLAKYSLEQAGFSQV